MDKLEIVKALLSDNEPSGPKVLPFEIGEAYFIRTVTYHCTGLLKSGLMYQPHQLNTCNSCGVPVN